MVLQKDKIIRYLLCDSHFNLVLVFKATSPPVSQDFCVENLLDLNGKWLLLIQMISLQLPHV